MIKVAITGGICSGKSTVCKYIEELGHKVYYSDDIAKGLIYSSKPLQKDIINEFSEESFIKGRYNTDFISNIVFKNDAKLKRLNEIFKPYIDENFNEICEKNKNNDIIFYESALIFEHKKEFDFDKIISIFAEYNIVVSRLKSRNNYGERMIKERLQSQMSPLTKNAKADYVVNTSPNEWQKQVDDIMNQILTKNETTT